MRKVIFLTLILLLSTSLSSTENVLQQKEVEQLQRELWIVNIVNSYDLITLSGNTGHWGLTYDWIDDALWVSLSTDDDKIYQIDKTNGDLIWDRDFSGGPSTKYGIAYGYKLTDWYKIYVSSYYSIYKYDIQNEDFTYYRGCNYSKGLGWDIYNDAAYCGGYDNQCYYAKPSQNGSWQSFCTLGIPRGIACSFSHESPSDHIFVTAETYQTGYIGWFENNNGIPGQEIITYYLPLWMHKPKDCAFDGNYVYVINSDPNGDKIAILDVFTPPAPKYLTAAVTPENNIDLNWDNVPREDGYHIYKSWGPPNWIYAEIAESPTGPDENYVTDYDLDPYEPWVYYYKVTSYNGEGESNFSPVAQETTLITEDAQITLFEFQPLAARTLVKWCFNAGAYEISRVDWDKAGPMDHMPGIEDYSYYTSQYEPVYPNGVFWDLSVPPPGWWVGYRGTFYTKYGYPSVGFKTPRVPKQRPGADPPIAATADTSATAYSNSKKIVVDSNGRMHITFTSNDTVYYVYSDDCERFSTPVAVGNGRYPGIALDGNDYPHICWVRENSEYEGYILYHSKLTLSGWTSPDELLEETDREFTPPSFDIDKLDNVSYLSWADFPIEEEKWIFYKGSFSLLDTTPHIEPVAYDSAVEMSPESPNYICDQTGFVDVDGYLLWEKEGEVYAGIEVNGVVQYITNLSNSVNPSIHPNLSIWGDSLYAVWQEEFPFDFENKILFAKRSTAISSNWEDPVELTFFPDIVEFPACHGPFIVATGKTRGGNYDISILRKDEFGDIQYIYGITETNTKSKFPAVCYTQNFPEQELYVIWTEDTTSTRGQPVGTVKAKMILETTPIPKIAVNLGSSDGSPYTKQREGYKIFGNLAFMSVDYHPQELIYRFTGLKPSESYKLKLIFYYEDEERSPSLLLKVKAGEHIIGGVNVEPDEPRYFEKWIPSSAYQSGTVDISIEKWIGDYDFAVCSEIFLYEYEENNGSEGAQLAENLENFPQKMQFIAPKPNPFMGSTKIGFVIPQKEEISLKIYDVSGRLCNTLVNKKLDAGTYYYNWDGKGENAKRSVCGVYFSVLNIGEKRFVRKIVKIK